MDKVNENKKKIRFYVVFGIIGFILLNLCWWLIARADGRVFEGNLYEWGPTGDTYVEWVPPHDETGIFIGANRGVCEKYDDDAIKGSDFRDDFHITTEDRWLLPDAEYKICDFYLTAKDNTLTIHYKTRTDDLDLDGEDFTLKFQIFSALGSWNWWEYKFHDGRDQEGWDKEKYTFSPDEIKKYFYVDDDSITLQQCLADNDQIRGSIDLYTIRMDDFVGE